MRREYYWDTASNKISKILRNVFSKNMSICEIGFSNGHFLEWLNDNGYKNLSGIEIREDAFQKTAEKFQQKHLNINLHLGDVFAYSEHFDGIYATGLIQCFDSDNRHKLLAHMSQLADIAVFTVPEIKEERNQDSDQLVAVAGCQEYKTGNIPYDLSQYYDTVRVGFIGKKTTHLADTLIYYICNNVHIS